MGPDLDTDQGDGNSESPRRLTRCGITSPTMPFSPPFRPATRTRGVFIKTERRVHKKGRLIVEKQRKTVENRPRIAVLLVSSVCQSVVNFIGLPSPGEKKSIHGGQWKHIDSIALPISGKTNRNGGTKADSL